MSLRETLEKRADELRNALEKLPNGSRASAHKIREHLESVDALLLQGLQHDSGDPHPVGPMGTDAFLVTRILYKLERCENLLRLLEEPRKDSQHTTDVCGQFVFPTIRQGMLFSFFRIVLSLRGQIRKNADACDWPRFGEVLSMRLPYWVAELRMRLRALSRR